MSTLFVRVLYIINHYQKDIHVLIESSGTLFIFSFLKHLEGSFEEDLFSSDNAVLLDTTMYRSRIFVKSVL